MPNNTSIIVYVVFSILIMGIMTVLLIKSNNISCSPYTPTSSCNKDIKLCLCSMDGRKRCVDRYEVHDNYYKGYTEYQDFGSEAPVWKSTDFDKY